MSILVNKQGVRYDTANKNDMIFLMDYWNPQYIFICESDNYNEIYCSFKHAFQRIPNFFDVAEPEIKLDGKGIYFADSESVIAKATHEDFNHLLEEGELKIVDSPVDKLVEYKNDLITLLHEIQDLCQDNKVDDLWINGVRAYLSDTDYEFTMDKAIADLEKKGYIVKRGTKLIDADGLVNVCGVDIYNSAVDSVIKYIESGFENTYRQIDIYNADENLKSLQCETFIIKSIKDYLNNLKQKKNK